MENIVNQPEEKKENYSYSKLEVYEQCPYKFKLIYKDRHFIHDDSVATDFGTLLHYIEETMAKKLTTTFKLDEDDYKELISLAYNAYDENEQVYGYNTLIEKWKDEWNVPDKLGRTYEDKFNEYITKNIYRLRNYLIQNPDLEIIGIEQPFEFEYRNYIFKGFIDRVYRDTSTGQIIVEDIKTWKEPAKEDKLKTPLQFVVYALALKNIYNITNDNMIKGQYELIICDQKQDAGTKGFIKRGISKLNKLFDAIEQKDFHPIPQVLCHWCQFCKHNENQKEEAKGLCPYYSLRTPENKQYTDVKKVDFEWAGMENHEKIMEAFAKGSKLEQELKESIIIKPVQPVDQNSTIIDNSGIRRYFILRKC